MKTLGSSLWTICEPCGLLRKRPFRHHPVPHGGLVWVRFCIKPPFQSGILVFFPRFFPLFCKTNPTCIFPNIFISKYFRIFQLGSFRKNTLFWKDPCQPPFCRFTPKAFGAFPRMSLCSMLTPQFYLRASKPQSALWEPNPVVTG